MICRNYKVTCSRVNPIYTLMCWWLQYYVEERHVARWVGFSDGAPMLNSRDKLGGCTVSETATTIELTADVVASYVGNHQLAAGDLPALIQTIYGGFKGEPEAASSPAVSGPTRSQIRKSVTPDAIISFEDGRGYKLLRRYLAKYNLTPAAYRAKWGLPIDCPMVAPAYHDRRSAQAKVLGLGRKAAPPEPAPKKVRKPRAPKASAG
jgi:predicted transcriptional regulator